MANSPADPPPRSHILAHWTTQDDQLLPMRSWTSPGNRERKGRSLGATPAVSVRRASVPRHSWRPTTGWRLAPRATDRVARPRHGQDRHMGCDVQPGHHPGPRLDTLDPQRGIASRVRLHGRWSFTHTESGGTVTRPGFPSRRVRRPSGRQPRSGPRAWSCQDFSWNIPRISREIPRSALSSSPRTGGLVRYPS